MMEILPATLVVDSGSGGGGSVLLLLVSYRNRKTETETTITKTKTAVAARSEIVVSGTRNPASKNGQHEGRCRGGRVTHWLSHC